jgi:hypothetical protein
VRALICVQPNVRWGDRILEKGDRVVVDEAEARHLCNLHGGSGPNERVFILAPPDETP